MSFLIRLFTLFCIILPLPSAQPTRHIDFHRRRNHHRRAHRPSRIGLPLLQRPLVDSKPNTHTLGVNKKEVLVSVYFASIPEWPKTGEQASFVTVPLDIWIKPGMWHTPQVKLCALISRRGSSKSSSSANKSAHNSSAASDTASSWIRSL